MENKNLDLDATIDMCIPPLEKGFPESTIFELNAERWFMNVLRETCGVRLIAPCGNCWKYFIT